MQFRLHRELRGVSVITLRPSYLSRPELTLCNLYAEKESEAQYAGVPTRSPTS